MRGQNCESREKGVSLILGIISLVMIIPMLGLSVDAGILYASKARLQSAVDGASLAAARALNLGQTIQEQTANAQQNAVNWFYANFPAGNWSTSNTQMTTSSVTVTTGTNVRSISVTASSNVPTYFMKWF